MQKKVHSFRLSDLAAGQLAQLARLWGTSATETLSICIDRAHKGEMKMQPGIYVTPQLPLHWVVCDTAGAMHLVGTNPGSWAERTPYRGHTSGLGEPAGWGLAKGMSLVSGMPLSEVGMPEARPTK